MSEKQIVVVVTKTIAVSEPDDSRYCVEFHHRAAGSWLVSWTQHLWSTSPRQAAIKASASVGGAAPNTEFYYNGEKVYETAVAPVLAGTPGPRTARIVYQYNDKGHTLVRFFDNETGEDFTRKVDERITPPGGWLLYSSCRAKQTEIHKFFSAGGSYCSIDKLGYEVDRVDPSEPDMAASYTPEYRALERRLEEAQEEASKLRKSEKLWVQLCDRGQKFFAWAQSKDLGLWGDSHFDTVPAAYEKLEKERDEYKKLRDLSK